MLTKGYICLEELLHFGKDVVSRPLDIDGLRLELLDDGLGVLRVVGQPLLDGVGGVVKVAPAQQPAGEDLVRGLEGNHPGGGADVGDKDLSAWPMWISIFCTI